MPVNNSLAEICATMMPSMGKFKIEEEHPSVFSRSRGEGLQGDGCAPYSRQFGKSHGEIDPEEHARVLHIGFISSLPWGNAV